MTTKAELLKRVRLNCVECMGGPRYSENTQRVAHHVEDIEECTGGGCAFYPFRFGKDPWPSRTAPKALLSSTPGRRGNRQKSKKNAKRKNTS